MAHKPEYVSALDESPLHHRRPALGNHSVELSDDRLSGRNRRAVHSLVFLSGEDKLKILQKNPLRVFRKA